MSDTNILIERELTFLARELPAEIAGKEPEKMFDLYLPGTVAHPLLRVRQRGQKYEITKKIPIDGADSSRQTEQSIPLTEEEFLALRQANGKVVEKERYKVVIAGREAEVDVFTGELKGLVVIDFEFETDAEMQAFTAPGSCLADVTQEEFIAGGVLAGKSYEDIEEMLSAFNYQKL